jgi:hypothetical protein
MKTFVYQRVHVSGGRALHLADHLALAARAIERIYGVEAGLDAQAGDGRLDVPGMDEREIAARIATVVRANHALARTSATVVLRFAPQKECEIEFERGLLEAGYAHSPLRPRAVTCEYSIPFVGWPTNFAIEARELFDFRVARQHGASRSVHRQGDRLLACGDAPLFAIRGRALVTPSSGDTGGGFESVERALVIEAAEKMRLSVSQEPILCSELKNYDELFFADAAGITSLADCDGAKFMAIVAPKLKM